MKQQPHTETQSHRGVLLSVSLCLCVSPVFYRRRVNTSSRAVSEMATTAGCFRRRSTEMA